MNQQVIVWSAVVGCVAIAFVLRAVVKLGLVAQARQKFVHHSHGKEA